jgi:3-hydroxyacyl-[acyl-carrier-protein] dehydratase
MYTPDHGATSQNAAFEPLSSQQIQQTIPHRSPFLLVDEILADDPQTYQTVGLKRVTGEEPFFQGHFPGYPIMPAVLIAEALAQVVAVALLRRPEYARHLPMLVGLEQFRFRKPVIPGDTLRLETSITRLRDDFGRARGQALVEGTVVAEGEIIFVVRPVPPG